MFNFFKKNLTEEQLKQLDATVEKFKKNPHQFRFTVVFFLTSILFGVLSIYLLQQKFALLMQKNGKVEIKEVIKNVPVPPPDVTLEPSQEATSAAVTEDINSWKFKKNTACNILLPLSPYQSADNEIKTWKSFSMSEGDGLSAPFLNIFDQRELAGFSSDDKLTDSGRIVIYCAQKQENKPLAELKTMIDQELAKTASDQKISIISSLEKTLWNKNALEITFSGGEIDGQIFYLTSTDKHFYLIGKQATSSDEVVKKDVERMLHGLIFLD